MVIINQKKIGNLRISALKEQLTVVHTPTGAELFSKLHTNKKL